MSKAERLRNIQFSNQVRINKMRSRSCYNKEFKRPKVTQNIVRLTKNSSSIFYEQTTLILLK